MTKSNLLQLITSEMVSVIVVTYNQQQYIAKALDGILMQQGAVEYEILVGDDCSTDGTQLICQAYAIEYPDKIRYIANETNKGLVQNFCDLLKLCRGDYVALCDGDDYWIDSSKLQKQIRYMEAHHECVLVHSAKKLLINGILVSQTRPARNEDPCELFYNPYICVPTVMFRMRCIKGWLPYYERYANEFGWKMQDYPLWLYLGTHGTFAYIDEEQVVYRVLNGSLSREQNKKRKYAFDKSVLDIKLFFVNNYPQISCNDTQNLRFQTMVFHMRKRMLLDYGWTAREQFWKLISMPVRVWINVIRKKLNS